LDEQPIGGGATGSQLACTIYGELAWISEFNAEVNKIRWMIEQVISHFKNWTIMHTDYRHPLNTFETTISAAAGLLGARTRPARREWRT
jgi:hypothetical protein